MLEVPVKVKPYAIILRRRLPEGPAACTGRDLLFIGIPILDVAALPNSVWDLSPPCAALLLRGIDVAMSQPAASGLVFNRLQLICVSIQSLV